MVVTFITVYTYMFCIIFLRLHAVRGRSENVPLWVRGRLRGKPFIKTSRQAYTFLKGNLYLMILVISQFLLVYICNVIFHMKNMIYRYCNVSLPAAQEFRMNRTVGSSFRRDRTVGWMFQRTGMISGDIPVFQTVKQEKKKKRNR